MTREELYKVLWRCWKLQDRLGDDLLVTIRCGLDYSKELLRYEKAAKIQRKLEAKFLIKEKKSL